MAERGLLHLTRKPREENVKFRSVLAMLAFRVELACASLSGFLGITFCGTRNQDFGGPTTKILVSLTINPITTTTTTTTSLIIDHISQLGNREALSGRELAIVAIRVCYESHHPRCRWQTHHHRIERIPLFIHARNSSSNLTSGLMRWP